MLTIIEGKPGSGKSYYATLHISEVVKQKRKIYTNLSLNLEALSAYVGFDASQYVTLLDDDFLKQDKSLAPIGGKKPPTDSPYYWWNRFENGALIVIDEIQRILMKTPEKLDQPLTDYFSKHRHRKQDWIFITQHMTGLSVVVRRNVEKVKSVLNAKSQRLPFPLWINGEDVQMLLHAFGVDRQVFRVKQGYLEGTYRVKYDDGYEIVQIRPEIFALYSTHTLDAHSGQSDRPLPYKQTGNIKVNAVLWFLKKYAPGVGFRLGLCVAVIFGFVALLFNVIPSFINNFSRSQIKADEEVPAPVEPSASPSVTAPSVATMEPPIFDELGAVPDFPLIVTPKNSPYRVDLRKGIFYDPDTGEIKKIPR